MAKNTTTKMNRKGLSDVITNVLIILLVIVAVGIIAAFVMPLLRNTGTQVTEGTSCLSANVEVASCVYNSSLPTNPATLIIKRGAGAYSVEAVRYVLERADGTTNVTSFTATDIAAFTEFASISKSLTPNTSPPKSAGAAVTMTGAKNSCPESPRVTCVPYK